MTTKEVVDAKKQRYGAAEALELLSGMNELIVAKGKKVTHVSLKKDRPDDDTLTSMLLGPTGNLRAPTMKVGKKILVGFNDEMYTDAFT